MILGGLLKTTLIDFPETIACTVFTVGCNFRCGFCHNPELVKVTDKPNSHISEKSFFEFLEKRKKQLEGVCVTGGEPCLQEDLPDFIEKIRKMGFLVKLDTNGTNPEMLKELLDNKMIDYIAMDIKSSLDEYEKLVGLKLDEKIISASIDLIKKEASNYEFRTTLVPGIHDEDSVSKMGKMIEGANLWVLQNFQNRGSLLDPEFKKSPSFPPQKLQDFQKIGEKFAKKCDIRN